MKHRVFILAILLLTSGVCIAQTKKSVSIFGDSYSTFEGYLQPDTNAVWYFKKTNFTDVVSVEQTWWHIFIEENGYRLCQNNSFSGSTICNTGYQKQDYTNRSFITRMDNLGCPDIILIFGATNDSWAGVPIGEYKYENWTKEDLYSFRPAMAYMLHDMKQRYQNAEIYFILNDDLKTVIDESVYTICNHYNVDCITLKDIHKINGHPSVDGMRAIADQIKEYINNK